MPDQATVKNLLLRTMDAADYARLEPSMVRVDLRRGEELVHPGQSITHCWFLEEGIASIVAMSSEGHETEAGIVGRDGMIDTATILGVTKSPNRCFIQIAGIAYRMPSAALSDCIDVSSHARSLFNRYVHALLGQLASTALANAAFTIEQRLARWLLMCADRLGRSEISLTHELLSVMLNVRRAGVTQAIRSLQTAGVLKASRGVIMIVDRPALTRILPDGYEPVISD